MLRMPRSENGPSVSGLQVMVVWSTGVRVVFGPPLRQMGGPDMNGSAATGLMEAEGEAVGGMEGVLSVGNVGEREVTRDVGAGVAVTVTVTVTMVEGAGGVTEGEVVTAVGSDVSPSDVSPSDDGWAEIEGMMQRKQRERKRRRHRNDREEECIVAVGAEGRSEVDCCWCGCGW